MDPDTSGSSHFVLGTRVLTSPPVSGPVPGKLVVQMIHLTTTSKGLLKFCKKGPVSNDHPLYRLTHMWNLLK